MAIPAKAKKLLDFIRSIEAPQGYGTIFGNNQAKLKKPLTSMTIGEVIAAGPSWTKRFGSSAAGGLQFMRATLQGLVKEGKARRDEIFDADCQDRLGYALLQRRGFDLFVAGRMSRTAFARALAQEWASFPVLVKTQGQHRTVQRGQSYYAGDGVNKALVSPIRVEAMLASLLGAAPQTPADPPKAAPAPVPEAQSDNSPEVEDSHEEEGAPEPEKKLRWSKRLWIWLTTGGAGVTGMLNESGLLFLDRYVLLAILGLIVAAAAFSIIAMPQVRRQLGISFK